MIDQQPTSQTINRGSTPPNTIEVDCTAANAGGSIGGLGGLVYGIYKGLKVTSCPAACHAYANATLITTYDHYFCNMVGKSCACGGISFGMFLAGVACGVCAFESVKACNKSCVDKNIHNPESGPTEDESEEANITSRFIPAPPDDSDLFPPPYSNLFPLSS